MTAERFAVDGLAALATLESIRALTRARVARCRRRKRAQMQQEQEPTSTH